MKCTKNNKYVHNIVWIKYIIKSSWVKSFRCSSGWKNWSNKSPSFLHYYMNQWLCDIDDDKKNTVKHQESSFVIHEGVDAIESNRWDLTEKVEAARQLITISVRIQVKADEKRARGKKFNRQLVNYSWKVCDNKDNRLYHYLSIIMGPWPWPWLAKTCMRWMLRLIEHLRTGMVQTCWPDTGERKNVQVTDINTYTCSARWNRIDS